MTKLDVLDVFKRRTRSPHRPRSGDVIKSVFPHFRQHPPYKGSLILGDTDQWDKHLYIIGQQKPKPEDLRTKSDLNKLNFGMLTAKEHSHILRFINKAVAEEENNAAVIAFIDTYGADISMESARDFQAFFIAHLIKTFINLPMPSVSVVLGEGGSGGAMTIQFADRRAQMDDALYATAPPESMAAIIFRDPKKIREALNILKPTAPELRELGVIDQIIPAPKDVNDVEGFARPIASFLERSLKELFKIKIHRLLEERRNRAEAFGLPKAKSSKLMHFFSRTPLKEKNEDLTPPDLKIFTMEDSALQVRFDYGNGLAGTTRQGREYIKCGDTSRKSDQEEGCGELILLKDYLKSFHVCPNCGRTRVMGAFGWIDCLTDSDTFHELYRDLSVEDILDPSLMTPDYQKFLAKQVRRTHFREALVTGEAKIFGHDVVLGICEFYYSGGSMGVVFGEKFRRAVDYAVERRVPFISLCCSGGARLYEGILALMQMVKTVTAVEKLKRNGLPYLSILADPATGGALASFAALGDVVIAEPGAMVLFAGPRVMKSRGFPVEEESIRADSLYDISVSTFDRLSFFQGIRGIHEIAPRKDMKRVLCKYLEFYEKTSMNRNGR